MDIFTLVFLLVFCLIAGLVVMFFFLGVFSRPRLPAMQEYVKQEYLLSSAELAFFTVLLTSVAQDEYVFAKVRIGDLIRVNGLVIDSKDWWRKFGPIAKKHVDFVVCTRGPVKPLIVFELDDSSHLAAKAQARDSLVDRVMQAAGLPLVHIPYNARGYSRVQLQAHIVSAKRGVMPHQSSQISVA